MYNTTPSLADIAAVTNSDKDGFGNGNGWWFLIILLALFGGWGNNGNNPASSDLQRGFDTASLDSKINQVANGLSSLGYDQLSQMNGISRTVTAEANTLGNAINQATYETTNLFNQGFNALQAGLSNCCCQNREAIAQVRYDMATDACGITNSITQATQSIMQNCNDNYRSMHDEIVDLQMEAKNDKISDLQSQIQELNLRASQQAQNSYLINELRPAAVPSYNVPNPYYGYGYSCTRCSNS